MIYLISYRLGDTARTVIMLGSFVGILGCSSIQFIGGNDGISEEIRQETVQAKLHKTCSKDAQKELCTAANAGRNRTLSDLFRPINRLPGGRGRNILPAL